MKDAKAVLSITIIVILLGCDDEFVPSKPQPKIINKMVSGIGQFTITQFFENDTSKSTISFTNFSGNELKQLIALVTVFSSSNAEDIGFRSIVNIDSRITNGEKKEKTLIENYPFEFNETQLQFDIISLDPDDSLSGFYTGEVQLLSANDMTIGLTEGFINYQKELKFKIVAGSIPIDSIEGLLSSGGKFDGIYSVNNSNFDINGFDLISKILANDTLIFASSNNDSLFINLKKL